MTPVPRIVPAGDASLIVEFEERIDSGVNARAIAVAAAIRAAGLVGVLEVVPAFRTLAVYFDPVRTDATRLVPALAPLASAAVPSTRAEARTIDVPVCYGGDFGPDLGIVAAFAGLDEARVIAMHAGATYHVFMLGFSPGFAYLGPVDRRIAAPRRETPRTRVPAGSVAIAGGQTGIYPLETPGGWQVIGRTPIRPWDMARPDSSLFSPGDRVRFHPVGIEEFGLLTTATAGPAR